MSGHTGSRRRPYRNDRRAEAAAGTRTAILDAALRLFVAHGYAKVTIGDIAREAGIAVPTVYASTGGKSAILAVLMNRGVDDPVVERTLDAVRTATDAETAVATLAHGVRLDNERHLDVVQVMITAAAVEQHVEEELRHVSAAYRQALRVLAERLAELGALRPGLSMERATDMLWFLFGLPSWRLFVAEHGWSWDETERWLTEQAVAALVARPSDA
ncbi:TetR/AcrR family transcriptional regulator [Streptomyces justiciae]|uniref:TetR/AcrR family transcriptional regulator n=1 Tax=Streptomyces justiciae TaxID=2780140 RepID=UPI00188230A4|nr:TetR/AcrR family transcriptional regulator [Streptomyces justiciae]MBE8478410.1 TetR/AcrR family transcriptional regulator [Streptomyces justiciae]MCW8383852.1 TetR/AcrR family transcriptional regulator [Streptomyces justiciae]